jgi:hypothetical protein
MHIAMKAGLFAGIVALALAVTAFADGKKEEKIKLADCPDAVQKTIQDNSSGGTVTEVEKETKKDGSVVFKQNMTA